MRYIRDHYHFTPAADQWFRTEIRVWAAKKSARKSFLFQKKAKKDSPEFAPPATHQPPLAAVQAPVEPPPPEAPGQEAFTGQRMGSAHAQDAPIAAGLDTPGHPAMEETRVRGIQEPLKQAAPRKARMPWILGLVGAGILVALIFLLAPLFQESTPPPAPQAVVDNDSAAPGREEPGDEEAATKEPGPIEEKPQAETGSAVSTEGQEAKGEPERKTAAIPPAAVIPNAMKDEVYTIEAGDTLWSLARKVHGDPLLWPVLLGANRNLVRNPDLLRPGMNLKVPALEGIPTKPSALGQAEIADGYVHAFMAYRHGRNTDAQSYLREAVRRDPAVMERFPNLPTP